MERLRGISCAGCRRDLNLSVAAFECSRCHLEFYCGAVCQRRAWAAHRPVCRGLGRLFGRRMLACADFQRLEQRRQHTVRGVIGAAARELTSLPRGEFAAIVVADIYADIAAEILGAHMGQRISADGFSIFSVRSI